MANIIRAFEFGLHPKSKVIGEPQLGKRGLSPTLSKMVRNNLKTMMNCIATLTAKTQSLTSAI